VSKYEWKNSTSSLVFLYDIFNGNNNASESGNQLSGLKVNSLDAYFQIDPKTVMTYNDTSKKEHLNSSLNLMSTGTEKGIRVTYNHFPSKWFLESSFYVGVTIPTPSTPPTVDTMSLIIGLCVSIVIVLILFVAGCVYLQKKSEYSDVS